jgi:hypothetical protein
MDISASPKNQAAKRSKTVAIALKDPVAPLDVAIPVTVESPIPNRASFPSMCAGLKFSLLEIKAAG